jgi:hypothetical protein
LVTWPLQFVNFKAPPPEAFESLVDVAQPDNVEFSASKEALNPAAKLLYIT